MNQTTEADRLLEAVTGPSMPVNSIAMLNEIRAALDASGTNCLESVDGDQLMRTRAALWVLNAQVHGQLARVDLDEEWRELNEHHNQ